MTSSTQLGAGLVAPDRTTAVRGAQPAGPEAAAGRPHARRRVLVGAALVSPVALAVQYALSPAGLPRDEAVGFLAGVAEHPTRYTVALSAYLVAMATSVAVAATIALAGRRSAPWLSGAAAALLALGAIGGGGFAGLRLMAAVVAESGGPGAAGLWTAVQDGTPFAVLTPFLLCAILGTLVGTAALVRARRDVTVWAAPVFLAGFVLTSGEFPVAVSVLGGAVQLAALLPVARAALRP
ncbi:MULTISPECIES: hypothetical protein [unclassified Geodermatophilus]